MSETLEHDRLFVIAPNAWKLRVGTKGNRPELAVGITTGWSESPAMAREAGEQLAKLQLPATKGYRDHDAAVKEVPEMRLREWAQRRGYIDPETMETIRATMNSRLQQLEAENARLRKKRGGRERREVLLAEEEGDET